MTRRVHLRQLADMCMHTSVETGSDHIQSQSSRSQPLYTGLDHKFISLMMWVCNGAIMHHSLILLFINHKVDCYLFLTPGPTVCFKTKMLYIGVFEKLQKGEKIRDYNWTVSNLQLLIYIQSHPFVSLQVCKNPHPLLSADLCRVTPP